ncbi:hypothetical protein [Rhodoferax fermentans]|nr:hypothetical protein [Rhodoferax fermentans]
MSIKLTRIVKLSSTRKMRKLTKNDLSFGKTTAHGLVFDTQDIGKLAKTL